MFLSGSSLEGGEEDGGGSDNDSQGASRTGRSGAPRVPVGVGETTEDVTEADEFRLRLLEAVLGLYSNHPLNYGELEARFHTLSLFLCALPYYESSELKSLALKTLEVICVSFKVCACACASTLPSPLPLSLPIPLKPSVASWGSLRRMCFFGHRRSSVGSMRCTRSFLSPRAGVMGPGFDPKGASACGLCNGGSPGAH